MVKKMGRNELIQIVEVMRNPVGFSSEELNQMLLGFCMNCPDPVAANYLMVEGLDPMTPEQLVDRALGMPRRNISEIPASELPLSDPLRQLSVDE